MIFFLFVLFGNSTSLILEEFEGGIMGVGIDGRSDYEKVTDMDFYNSEPCFFCSV